MEDDYSLVTLTNPDGLTYQRNFDTPFLRKAGISEGDRIEIEFTEEVVPGRTTVRMDIRGQGPAKSSEEIQAEIDEIMAGVDMDKIRRVFGSNL